MGKLDYLSKYTDSGKKSKAKKSKKSKKKRPASGEIKIHDDEVSPLVGTASTLEEDAADEEDRPTVVASDDINKVDDCAQINKFVAVQGTDCEFPSSRGENKQEKRRIRHDSISNDDEPTIRRKRYDSDSSEDSSHSGQRRNIRKRYDSDDDEAGESTQLPKSKQQQPPNANNSNTGADKQSRWQRHDSSSEDDSSPAQRPTRHESDNDMSPRKQRQRHDSSDSSNEEGNEPPSEQRVKVEHGEKPAHRERMSSGHAAGLQQAKDFRAAEDIIQQRKKVEAARMVDKHGMGETVFRDKSGRQVEEHENADKKRLPKLSPEEQAELNKGRAQREKEEELQKRWEEVKNSTFARHAGEEGLDDAGKNVLRKGDPMAAFSSKIKAKGKSKSGKSSQRPVYKGPPAKPNRFGILPGYRWDGVDRGNGFEDKVLASKFSAQIKKDAAYRWSTSDM